MIGITRRYPAGSVNWAVKSEISGSLGHEEWFPPATLKVGCGFRKRTIAGTGGNDEDAPIADFVLQAELLSAHYSCLPALRAEMPGRSLQSATHTITKLFGPRLAGPTPLIWIEWVGSKVIDVPPLALVILFCRSAKLDA